MLYVAYSWKLKNHDKEHGVGYHFINSLEPRDEQDVDMIILIIGQSIQEECKKLGIAPEVEIVLLWWKQLRRSS